MRRSRDRQIEHLLRRAGFGASQDTVDQFSDIGYRRTIDWLLDYEDEPDTVDQWIGRSGFVGVTARGPFLPAENITDARQRWLFRMVHSRRPLQEKMALFWHNHFATAYSKIAGVYGGLEATRMLAATKTEHPGGLMGQLELFRAYALGNFRDLLIAVAQDPAMLVWLDGRVNVRGRPQENFARELLELFTMGVATFEETDVYAGARVFTGWNLARVGGAATTGYYRFNYAANQHDTGVKEFSFPIYSDGGRRIAARPESQGMQDGIDLINAVARHPLTGPRLARKLYQFFISEIHEPDPVLIRDLSRIYYDSNFEMKPVIARLLLSSQFSSRSSHHARYSWPVEFVVRALKEVGWVGFSVNDALTPLINMGQQLFEPPDVNGWELGPGWFSSGAMLARMNFAAQLATNQKFNLRNTSRSFNRTPDELLAHIVDLLSVPEMAPDSYRALLDYAAAGISWSGSDAQLATKASGLVHLIVGSGDYQLV
jgi:uncharacterized protein (DUF1800 family)